MGIHDRDYVRSSPRGNGAFSAFAHTALGTIILFTVLCWLAQEMTQDTIVVQPTFDSPVEHYEHRSPVTDASPVRHY